jgi:hypothetical protein
MSKPLVISEPRDMSKPRFKRESMFRSKPWHKSEL